MWRGSVVIPSTSTGCWWAETVKEEEPKSNAGTRTNKHTLIFTRNGNERCSRSGIPNVANLENKSTLRLGLVCLNKYWGYSTHASGSRKVEQSTRTVLLPHFHITPLKHQMLLLPEALSHQSNQHFLICRKLTYVRFQMTSLGTSHATKMLILVTFPSTLFLFFSFHFCLKIKAEARLPTFPIG